MSDLGAVMSTIHGELNPTPRRVVTLTSEYLPRVDGVRDIMKDTKKIMVNKEKNMEELMINPNILKKGYRGSTVIEGG